MKNLKYLSILFLSLLVFTACEEDEHDFGPITSPTNVQVTAEINGADDLNVNGDGTGFVTFAATANGALAYQFNFGDGNSETNSSGVVTHRYTQVGVNSYTVIVSAVGTKSCSSSSHAENTSSERKSIDKYFKFFIVF